MRSISLAKRSILLCKKIDLIREDAMRHKTRLAGILLAGVALALSSVGPSMAKDIKAVGISVGSLGNPGFVIIANTATRLIHKANPEAQVTTVGYDYDLGKQVNQIDNFI